MNPDPRRHRVAARAITLLAFAVCGAFACDSTTTARGDAGVSPDADNASGATGSGGISSGGAVNGGASATGTGGKSASGGAKPASGGSESGGAASSGGRGTGGNGSGGRGAGGTTTADSGAATACSDAKLVWKTANKTNYTSYPAPNSDECIKYSGCMYEGEFAACNAKEPESWVQAHDIVAAFPDYDALKLHDLCLRSGQKTIVVTVLDTCADSDCSGCCTQNKGSADELIDVESYTNDRWGVDDGPIEWADLGPTKTSGCN